MEEYGHVLLEALIDTAKILPLLFIVYYLIELLEFKYAIKFKNNRLLKGKASPVIGSLIGCIPQCGFSVITTDLYAQRAVSVGALIAVYIATNDEAIPLMIANPSSIPWLLGLIAVKIVMGIGVGYLSIVLYNAIFKKKKLANKSETVVENVEDSALVDEHTNEENADEHPEIKIETHDGCCHHHVESKSFDWLHPLLHCLKISAFILIINILFGCITHIWIGEENLTNFLSRSIYLQPLLTILIGLIPNCASSVVLTQLFIMGGLSFGALVAGLSVNAGLGLIILFKQNKNIKENIFILLMLIIPSLIVGYALNFI